MTHAHGCLSGTERFTHPMNMSERKYIAITKCLSSSISMNQFLFVPARLYSIKLFYLVTIFANAVRSGAYENKDDIVSKLCLTTMWYYRDLPHVSNVFFFPREKSISREKSGTSRNDVSLPCTPGNAIMLQHLIPSFLSIICQEVAYERLKTKDKFNLFALKVVVVPNVRWSFTKDSKCNDLTRKLLMFWKTGG